MPHLTAWRWIPVGDTIHNESARDFRDPEFVHDAPGEVILHEHRRALGALCKIEKTMLFKILETSLARKIKDSEEPS